MRNILFVVSSGPFETDVNFQSARMALALALDTEVSLVLMGPAVHLARRDCRIDNQQRDFTDQERFLVEMEIPIRVSGGDLRKFRIDREHLKDHLQVVEDDDVQRLIAEANILFET